MIAFRYARYEKINILKCCKVRNTICDISHHHASATKWFVLYYIMFGSKDDIAVLLLPSPFISLRSDVQFVPINLLVHR